MRSMQGALLQYLSAIATRATDVAADSMRNKPDERDILFVVRKVRRHRGFGFDAVVVAALPSTNKYMGRCKEEYQGAIRERVARGRSSQERPIKWLTADQQHVGTFACNPHC